jgi:hypothetical protein
LLAPATQSAVITWELVLAVWLFTQPERFASWLAAVLTFTGFACASGYLIAVGQASCQCFGAVEASPWAAVAIDVAVLVALIRTRPCWPKSWSEGVAGTLWPAAAISGLILVCVTCWAVFGSFSATAAHIRGERVGADYSYLDFGSAKPGERLEATLSVFNHGDRPVRIVGIASQCNCLSTQDLPLTIEVGDRASVRLVLVIPHSRPGHLARQLELFTEDPARPRIGVTAGCRVE